MTDFAAPQWLDVPRGRIAYERSGHGSPIVFLHAGIADRRIWDREFRAYADGATVVRYDRRGFGQSPPATGPYTEVEDLHALVTHLKLGPATIVGNSIGGSIALDYAIVHPEAVRGLLLVAGAVSGYDFDVDPDVKPVAEKDNERSAGIPAAWKAGRKDEAVEGLRRYWASATEGAGRDLAVQMFRENLEEIFEDRSAKHATPIDPPAARRLGEVRAPTVVLFGDRDEPTTGFIARFAARGIPGARYVPIPGADHLVNLSRPTAFDEALRSLLVGPPTGGRGSPSAK